MTTWRAIGSGPACLDSRVRGNDAFLATHTGHWPHGFPLKTAGMTRRNSPVPRIQVPLLTPAFPFVLHPPSIRTPRLSFPPPLVIPALPLLSFPPSPSCHSRSFKRESIVFSLLPRDWGMVSQTTFPEPAQTLRIPAYTGMTSLVTRPSPLTTRHSPLAALKTFDIRDYNHPTLSLVSPPLRPPCLQKSSVPDCLA